MKRRYTSLPLPRWWMDHPGAVGVVRECDIGVSLRSRVKLKVMLFRSRLAMRKSETALLGRKTCCPETAGVCHRLSSTIHSFKDGKETQIQEFDRRYFASIFLVAEDIDIEYLSHEAVHAAYCYYERVGRNVWGRRRHNGNDEEHIAYPAGRITWQLCDWLMRHGHLEHRGKMVCSVDYKRSKK